MQTFQYTVRAEEGMHARPAGLFVQLSVKCHSTIEVKKGDTVVNVKRIMAVMALCIKKGDIITFHVEGNDEDEIIREVESICRQTL